MTVYNELYNDSNIILSDVMIKMYSQREIQVGFELILDFKIKLLWWISGFIHMSCLNNN